MAIIIEENKFLINTEKNSYAFCVDGAGYLRNLYWGKKVNCIHEFEMEEISEVSTNDPVAEITNEEYPVHGSFRYKETCLKVQFGDGTREIRYQYAGYEMNGNHLKISLKDEIYGLEIELNYMVIEELDLIERWTVIKNRGIQPIKVDSIYSAQLHIPENNLKFRNSFGHWGAEQQGFVQQVSHGKIYFENRRGVSTHNHNPYFILDKNADETSGEVYFGVLKQGGNFKGIVEQTQYGHTLVQMGLNDYDFQINLNSDEEFQTPKLVIGYSEKGLGNMSHRLHIYGNEIMRNASTRKVLYNSWEATEFKVDVNEQLKLAEKAAELGVELFVVDDGWFGRRDSINDGLGDWWVNKDKFPHGLKPLIEGVKKLGMDFGIWIEPEMVNPNADLYKNHPDWIYSSHKRTPETSRGQLVLNLCKPEVTEFIHDMIDNLLSENDIDYIKWDVNRPIAETGGDQSIWYTHIMKVYEIVNRIKEKYPAVLIEACASGGGRTDFQTLEYFDDFWTSDNTDALDRLTIQKTYSYIYPIKAMRAWVTDCPNFLSKRTIPLKFRYHSAMMGTLGIGCNILKFGEEEKTLSKEMIAQYKDIREIVQNGEFHRLENNSTNSYEIFQYNYRDETLL
ncbi:MAG: alpha-galactosidase, partial [Fusobacteriaceae bacterium]